MSRRVVVAVCVLWLLVKELVHSLTGKRTIIKFFTNLNALKFLSNFGGNVILKCSWFSVLKIGGKVVDDGVSWIFIQLSRGKSTNVTPIAVTWVGFLKVLEKALWFVNLVFGNISTIASSLVVSAAGLAVVTKVTATSLKESLEQINVIKSIMR